MQITLDPPPPEDPLPLDGPQGLPWAMWANLLVGDHPMADPLEDGAWPWTTFPSTEMETIITTTITLDLHPKLKIHRMTLAMHLLKKANSTFKSLNPSLAVTPGSGLEDVLDCRPDSNVFSALATLLHAMVLAPDNLPAHLPSHSSTTLLLHTTLPFSNNPIPMLVNSSTIDNFIDESLVALAPHLL
ncbi:hypothetical protein E4T56_gene1252 [Termitomyces sp. T112]|nr:hypothetical protein E4T56_gene1252 [Termitomyces sp. T112]